jgi:hypothetical protein
MLMRKLVVLICVLGVPCASLAQSNSASWDNLKALQAGEKIQVAQIKSKTVSGPFVSVSDAAISVEVEGGPQTIQRQEVRSVRLARHGHRLRNSLIGGGVGAGVGAGIGAATDKPCQPCFFSISRGTVAEVFAAGGFAIGAAIGALLPSHVTIYRAH